MPRRNADRKCPCGSGKTFGECDPVRGVAACVDCGEPFHPRNNRHVRCGSAETGEGCSGVRRRKVEAARKRAARREGPALA